MKFIKNIFLIIIIAFSLSIIPINAKLLNYDLSDLISQEEIPEEQEKIKEEIKPIYTIESKTQTITQPEIEFTISTNQEDPIESIINSFDFTIYNNSDIKLSKKIKDLNYLTEISTNRSLSIYKVSLDLTSLKLPNGYYNITIQPTSDFKKTLKYDYTLLKNKTYIGSNNQLPENKLYAKIYLPDRDFLRLVPINRPIENTEALIRATINQLLIPAKEKYGLNTTVAAPRTPNIFISQGVATLDLNPSEIEEFDQGSAAATFALNSLIKTMSHFKIVDEIKFNVVNPQKEAYFHGTDLSEPFKVSGLPKAFVGLESATEYMYLYPLEISEEKLTGKINTLFNTLQTATHETEATKNLFPTLPSEVKLLNYRFNGRNLELDLSEDFLTAFNDKPEYQKLMYDSLLYSFTSIEGIETLSILVKGKKITTEVYPNISEPTKPNKYINTLN